MTEQARVDQLVARYDEEIGCYVLTGWLPGPAGVASLPIAGGEIVVDVDYATPGTISQIGLTAEHRSPSDDALAALEALTYVPGWRVRLEGVDGRPRIVWQRERGGGFSSLPELGGAGLVGRLAILLAEHENPRRTPFTRGMAALDAANTLANAPTDLQIQADPVELWNAAVSLLEPATDGDAGPLAVDDGDELEDYLNRAVRFADRYDPLLGLRLDRLRRHIGTKRAATAAATRPMFARGAFRAPADSGGRLDLEVAVDPVLDVTPTRAELVDGVLRVSATGIALPANDIFLRVFRSGFSPIPIAVVPFDLVGADDPNGVALVPNELTAADLFVELTTTPYEPPLTRFARDVTHAVRIGQDASRSTRRGDALRAEREWQICGGEWRAVGDDRRANLAEAYADGPNRLRRGSMSITSDEPLLSDLAD